MGYVLEEGEIRSEQGGVLMHSEMDILRSEIPEVPIRVRRTKRKMLHIQTFPKVRLLMCANLKVAKQLIDNGDFVLPPNGEELDVLLVPVRRADEEPVNLAWVVECDGAIEYGCYQLVECS